MKNRFLMVVFAALVAATTCNSPALAQNDGPGGYSHAAHSDRHGGHHGKHHGRHHRHGKRHHKHRNHQ